MANWSWWKAPPHNPKGNHAQRRAEKRRLDPAVQVRRAEHEKEQDAIRVARRHAAGGW